MPPDNPRDDRIDRLEAEWHESWKDLNTDGFGVVGRILLIGHHLDTDGTKVLREFDLQTGEFDVLATLRRAGKPYALSMGELCRDVILSSGGMTHRVDRLLERGLVSRAQDPRDRRAVLVSLTDTGLELVESALLRKVERATALTSVFSEKEAATLKALLRRLLLEFEDINGGKPTR